MRATVSDSIGLTFLVAAGAPESASLAQIRVPPSSARALSQYRAPAAPSARAHARGAHRAFDFSVPVAALRRARTSCSEQPTVAMYTGRGHGGPKPSACFAEHMLRIFLACGRQVEGALRCR